jgi:hypothetical protein
MPTFRQDVRYALRMLAKSPLLTVIVVLTLALGIGANTTIFGIVDGVLLRPLPVKTPEQIMVLAAKVQGDNLGIFTLSYPQLLDLQKQANAFSDVIASEPDLGGLSVNGQASQFLFNGVTGNYFSALGVQPAMGRLFLPSEGQAGGKDPYVVLGYSCWQKKFGGDPSLVGKQVTMNGQAATIIGVAPKGFQGTAFALDFDAYVPLNMVFAADTPGLLDRPHQPFAVGVGPAKTGGERAASANLDRRGDHAARGSVSRDGQGSGGASGAGKIGAAATVRQ